MQWFQGMKIFKKSSEKFELEKKSIKFDERTQKSEIEFQIIWHNNIFQTAFDLSLLKLQYS